MNWPSKIIRQPGKAIQQDLKFGRIFLEVDRMRATSLLIDLRYRPESLRPSNRHPKTTPLQQLAGIREAEGSGRDLTHIKSERIINMTEHLVRGHFAPATRHLRG